MPDFKKGIIEINGIEIDRNTTLDDFRKSLSSIIRHDIGDEELTNIWTYDVRILDRFFRCKFSFYFGSIDYISLYLKDDIGISYEEKFKADCEWLKSILGKPDEVNDDGNTYFFDGIHIYSFIQRNLTRNPAETFIVCKYDK